MSVVKARPWSANEKFYRDKIINEHWNLQPMLKFVHDVAMSDYADVLYATTSLNRLVIGRTPEFEFTKDVISVEYFSHTQLFRFEYFESVNRHDWSQECGPADAYGILVKLLRLKRWCPVPRVGGRELSR